MPKKTSGLREYRIRVTLYLPVGEITEKNAVWGVVRYLEQQRRSLTAPVTGFTRSEILQPVFFGHWYDGGWVREPVVTFVIDYEHQRDEKQFDRVLERLVRTVKREYGKRRRRQEVVWMIAQQATRFV
jgi:hypothetical protein